MTATHLSKACGGLALPANEAHPMVQEQAEQLISREKYPDDQRLAQSHLKSKILSPGAVVHVIEMSVCTVLIQKTPWIHSPD